MNRLERKLTKCVEQAEKTGAAREVYIAQLTARLAKLEEAAREYMKLNLHEPDCHDDIECDCPRGELRDALEDSDE